MAEDAVLFRPSDECPTNVAHNFQIRAIHKTWLQPPADLYEFEIRVSIIDEKNFAITP